MLRRNHTRNVTRSLRSAVFAALAAVTLTGAGTQGADAYENVLAPGDSIVTGFSGIQPPSAPTEPNGGPADVYFIDLDGSSAQILSMRSLEGAPDGALASPVGKYRVTARDVGQVFAIALDDGQGETVPYIYFGATSYFGLEIVVPDPSGDGTLKRVKIGHPDARWMPGQFGEGGDPGAIWRVNGNTGEVTLFASLPDNSGPGIGDIVFDENAGQFYVSDLDTGLIYRIDEDGSVIDSFDHGVDGREVAGLAAIEDDSRAADIESSTFNGADPATWGYTQKHRRVAGMAVREGRLYYAVADGPQVWSVGIAEDGRFTGKARMEFNVGIMPGSGPVTDMAFDRSGRLYLAQRGEQRAGDDYSRFAETGKSSVVRFRLVASDEDGQDPIWVKDGDGYAIGAGTGDQSNGGIALGFGHDDAGGLLTDKPDAMLWTTGDRLSSGDPSDGVTDVNGLQGNDVSLLRPLQDATKQSYFIDYDGVLGDGPKASPMGDVEIWQPIEETVALVDEAAPAVQEDLQYPLGFEPPGDMPPEDFPPDSTTPQFPFNTNLKLTKRAVFKNCTPHAAGWTCKFKIRVKNTGPDTYIGPVLISDRLVNADGATLGFGSSSNWNCWTIGTADYRCRRQVVLPAGASVSLTATALVPYTFDRCRLMNVAKIRRAPGGSRWNANASDDRDTAVVKIPSDDCTPETEEGPPDVEYDPIPRNTNLKIEKEYVGPEKHGREYDWSSAWRVTVTNTGPGTFNDVITFDEMFPAGAAIEWTSSDLTCTGSQCVSNGPVVLGASPAGNASKSYMVYLSGSAELASELNCELTNQVKIVSPSGFPIKNTDPSDDTATATGELPERFCEKDELTPTRVPEQDDITSLPTTDCPSGHTLTHGECLPKAVHCPGSYQKVEAARVSALRNNGWTVQRVRQNGQTLWCGKPGKKPEHSCRKGWKQVASKGRVPQGWRSYSVGRGSARIWCVRKADKAVQKCTRPARWNGKTCVCPGHSTWNGKRCVKPKVKSQKTTTQKTTTQKRCKRGFVGHPPNCRRAATTKRRHQRTRSQRGRK